MAVNYTADQQKVIDLRDCNILVSAAAGSGKTAVLTERIIQRICDVNHPVQIDRMLIVTFTNAAAAEMRERIGTALRKRLEKEPENIHLRKQITLLSNAQITTIDSFCLYLLRNHFHEIQLDPGFRIADEGEIKLLQEDVLQDYLEAKYEDADDAFLDLVEKYAGNGKDDELKKYILKLYRFAQSHPFPEEYLEQCICELCSDNGGFHDAYEKVLYEHEMNMMEECIRVSHQAIDICRMPGGPAHYEEALADDIVFYEAVMNAGQRCRRAELHASHTFKTLSRSKPADLDEELKNRVTDLRNKKCKKIVDEISKKFYYASEEDIIKDNKAAGKDVAEILKLVLGFSEIFQASKRERNMIDFSDMEHMALQILLKKEGDVYVPGEVALNYRDYFEEIMVDEYQDSNQVQELLLESISRQSEDYGNRFMVGDVKQSIYRFRLACPEIFMAKYEAFHSEKGKNRRINLSKNFRSRKEVLGGVNAVFEELMIPQVGNISYDKDARLYYGADYSDNTCDYNGEILLYDKTEFAETHLSDIEAEAMIMASRMKELCGEFLVTDQKTRQLRPARYGDMVILLRAATGVDDIIKKILEAQGIPTYVSSGKGYFAAPEIREILNYLAVLNNPRQDIPLLGVMHSYFGNFSEEEIACIRVFNRKKGRLYDSVKRYAEAGGEAILRNKVQMFVEQLEQRREKTIFSTVYSLLEEILEAGGYMHYCMALPGGGQRRANLLVLMQKAKAFESSGYSGLFDFIRYIELMQEREIDFGEANILDENADVVRIMTIHKSKGLEFPICFMAGCGKQFSRKDTSESILADAELGIGGEVIDLQLRCKRKSMCKNVIALKQKRDSRGEELRILYVAMTRAKEKLILVGCGSVSEDVRCETTAYDLLKAESFMDMVLPIAVSRTDLFDLRQYSVEEVQMQQSAERVEMQILKDALKNVQGESIWTPYQYPNPSLEGLYTKTTVSELKKAAYLEEEEHCNELYAEEEMVPYVPAFIARKDKEIGGAGRGSAYHRVMELMDFTLAFAHDNIDGAIREIRKQSIEALRITPEEDQLVSQEKVLAFMKTELACRMGEAQKKNALYKEQPFMMGVKARTVRADFPEDEDILVQGVIDVYFEEEDGLVLLDYKTDRVSDSEELIKRYKTQLQYYAQALERLTHKKVKEKLIYSFALHEVIQV